MPSSVRQRLSEQLRQQLNQENEMNRSVHAEVYILRAAEVTFSAGRNSYEAVLMGDPPTVFVSKEDVRAIQTQHVIGVVERAGEAFHRALINSTERQQLVAAGIALSVLFVLAIIVVLCGY